MKKYIEATSIIIVLLFIISGGFVLAENASTGTEVSASTEVSVTGSSNVLPVGQKLRDQMRAEIQTVKEDDQAVKNQGLDQIKNLNQERQQNMADVKAQIQKTLTEKNDLTQEQKDNIQAQIKTLNEKQKEIVDAIKTKRDEFKATLAANKEQLQTKIEEVKTILKENLLRIKDEKKQATVEDISNRIINLNIELTKQLSDRVDQIESVLAGIKSRTDKAESAGLDVTAVKASITKVEDAITLARTSISTQSSKVYTINITTEANLKADVQITRDSFKADIKTTQDAVKNAHDQIVLTAKALAQIPKIDEVGVSANTTTNTDTGITETTTTNTVESNTTTTTN